MQTAPSSAAACGGNSYLHCRVLTWDHTQAGGSDTATFAGLVNATEADWADSGHGGVVQHTGNQSGGSYTSTIPYDFIITSDTGCTTKVAGWEFESYTNTSGAAIIWINIGTLSHTADTKVYACYDNAAVSTQQMTTTATWDSNYAAVYHFAGSLGLADSTSNGRTLSNVGATSAGGQIGNGAGTGAVNGLNSGAFLLGANIVTMEGWVNSSTMTTQGLAMWIEKSNVNSQWEIFGASGTLTCRGGNTNNNLTIAGMANSTWYYIGCSITGTSGVGYLQSAATSHTVDAFTDASSALNIGQYDLSGGAFTGTEDEIRVSKVVRSADYFTSHYNQTKASQTMVTIGAEQ